MVTGYWQRVVEADHEVPTDRELGDLTAELTAMLGSTDPDLRDGIAHPTLAAWIERGVYDDLLAGLGDGMAAGLTVGLGDARSDSVFRRSFSALVLACCLERDNERALMSPNKILDWGDRLTGWFVRERDLRGYVEGRGWAHAVAHGADGLGVLAQSRHFGVHELTVLLDVVADRLLLPSTVFTAGETDRLAAATMKVLSRNLVPWDVLEPWVVRVASAMRAGDQVGDPYHVTGNPEGYLRALHLHLAIGPERPAVRADLMLLLVDQFRTTHPYWFATPSGATDR